MKLAPSLITELFFLLFTLGVYAQSPTLQILTWQGSQAPGKDIRYSTQQKSLQHPMQSLCVQSGKMAEINFGAAVPIQVISVGWQQTEIKQDYQPVQSSFAVRAEAHRNYAEIKIYRQAQQFANNSLAINTQNVLTTLNVPYNRWVKFAGNENNFNSVTYNTQRSNRVDDNFYLKVILLAPGQYCQ
ncbi:MAG: hypothetical protein KIT27_00790 [Legionellales bacterium]|nr:hypothetical protein [Legionellales bacterium]